MQALIYALLTVEAFKTHCLYGLVSTCGQHGPLIFTKHVQLYMSQFFNIITLFATEQQIQKLLEQSWQIDSMSR